MDQDRDQEAVNHDRLFKELLTTFFVEFAQAFLPDMAAYLDATSLKFLDKEVFTDITAGESREVDIVVKARFRGQDAFFLIHVENQSSAQSGFPKRMFLYFARLHEKYDLPIYPVVIFSYDKPKRAEPRRYTVAFPGETVLQFKYKVIQLNRLSWRQFVKQPNPVAAALMSKMKMTAQDRPRVKVECLRLLATLRLDPARTRLIGNFIDSYLNLSRVEQTKYERELAALAPDEREATVEITNSWERKGLEQGLQEGRQEGRQEGKEDLVARQIRKRFGSVLPQVTQRLDQMPTDQLDELGEALFDFATVADLETWLSRLSAA